MTESLAIHTDRIAGGDPVLVLLHGLGATGEVWRGLLERHWPAEVIVPDLPGHGRSGGLDSYTFESMAGAVAAVLPTGRRLVIVGHSLGGVLALTLAGGPLDVTAVCGLGIKIRWSAAELAKAADLAARPSRVFATREEAVDRWLRISGLTGLVAADSVDAGVRESPEGWVVRVDQRAFGVGAPDVSGLVAASRAEVVLAAGELDPMCPAEHLHAVAPSVAPSGVVLPAVGHNAHVESPVTLWPILDRLLLS